jgi:broad specificity phosphatase PhoE
MIRLLTVLASITTVVASSRPAAAQATTIILVRHAEKSSPTGDAGLTAIGEQRVQDLVRAMANVRLAAVISTQFQRTRLTGEPVARAANLELTVVPAGPDKTANTAAIVRALDSLPSGTTALVVGHSNTLAGIIAALGGPALPDLCDGEHSTLFVLERPDGGKPVSLVRAKYGAAEPPEAGQCQSGR